MSQTKCKVCGELKGGKEPDPCLGYLPGISHACCGHGKTAAAYCVGWDGCKPNEPVLIEGRPRPNYFIYRGQYALEHMYLLKKSDTI